MLRCIVNAICYAILKWVGVTDIIIIIATGTEGLSSCKNSRTHIE